MTIPATAIPSGFQIHEFERTFEFQRGFTATWDVLMKTETFTRGQPWPYRVEFIDTPQPDGTVARGFDVGTLNAHHGPFLNFCGVVSRVEVAEDRASRDLEYAYGAYALAFRLIRPTRLGIDVESTGKASCRVTIRVESFVRPWIASFWTFAQRGFWLGFGPALRRQIPKPTDRV
ncbi:MAG: hypothetical protein CMJ23_01070 [Phycisphaerae bacterium]|nr:hypothetical protein [Phycisphaerae bacterium]